MAAAPGGRGWLGWAILAGALVVPGALFVNWSSHLKSEHDRGLIAKARSRVQGSSLFQSAPASARLSNPISSSTVKSGGAAPVAAKAVPSAAPATSTAATLGKPAVSPTGKTPVPAIAPAGKPGAPAAAPTPVAAPPSVSTPAVAVSSGAPKTVAPAVAAPASGAAPTPILVLSRDPMVSPMELGTIRAQAEAAERERLAAIDAARPVPKHHEPIEKKVNRLLQGTVSSRGTNIAIIDGKNMKVGQSFRVRDYPETVQIIKITESAVKFRYHGREFVLKVSVN